METPIRGLTPEARPPSAPKSRIPWWLIPVITLALVLLLITGFVAYYEAQFPATVRRPPAPNFKLLDQAGREHTLSDYLGRTIVLAGLGADGPAPRATLRALNQSLSRLEMHGVKVFGIPTMEVETARAVHRGEQLRFPLLTDAEGRVGAALGLAQRESGGVSVVVSPTGAVRATVRERDPARHAKAVLAMVECCSHEFAPPPSRALGYRLPNFYLPDAVSGRQVALFGDSHPAATALVFMSSECPCSQGYDHRLSQLASELARQGVRMVGINANPQEPVSEIAAHAKRCRLPFPMLLDRRQVVLRRLGARMTPEAYVADAMGTIRYHGRIDDNRDETQAKSHDLRDAALATARGADQPAAETLPFGCAIPLVTEEPAAVSADDARRRYFQAADATTTGDTK